MSTKRDLKRDFLGILKGETVKELTMKSDSVGMKNTKMREEIKKLLGELTDKCEEGSSVNTNIKVKEETEIKQENYSLSDTIRRLAHMIVRG